jgi:perosamine synthetase
MTQIPISKAVFDADDLALVQEPLRAGWVVQGRYVREFEDAFARMTGAPHAVAMSSCTTALHAAVAALGLGPGDEVIVPAFTWVATANCVEYMGAKPVFVDVDLDTFNLDPGQLEACVTPRTRGIIPVHLFGLPAALDTVMAVARRHGLWVLEDAACGFDAWWNGRHVGTIGDAGAFSFHPRKAITTGEGGMLVTSDGALAERFRSLRDHGSDRSAPTAGGGQSFLLPPYPHLGYNYRLTDIQGALGVAQMRKAEALMAQRREAAARYDALLAELEWLQPPSAPAHVRHGYQAYVCLFRPEAPTLAACDRLHEARNALMAALDRDGVMTRQGTHAPPHLDYYASKYGIAPGDLPGAYLAERLSLALPLYPGMTAGEVERVGESLRSAFAVAVA